MSTNAVEPLQIIIELTATGKTPIALDHAQFGFKIWKPKAVAFQGDLQFYNDVTNIISIFPNTNLVVNAAINTNDLNQSWHSLAPGSYNLQIDVGSGKLRQFDYQYMGQVHSEVYSLELK